MAMLRQAGVTLLNQSVLLRGVNDNAQTPADLSNALFDAGVMPYYLHVLDRVQERRTSWSAMMKPVKSCANY